MTSDKQISLHFHSRMPLTSRGRRIQTYSNHIRPMGRAHGPGPGRAGPGPRQNMFFLAYDINKKDGQRPYDPFAGGIAPRSLLCVQPH